MSPNNRRRASRRSGSVLVYILVLTIAMCTVVLTLVSMAGYQFNTVVHGEQVRRAQFAMEGARTQVRYDLAFANHTAPYSSTITVGTFSVPVTVTDYSATVPYTAAIAAGTARWNKTFTQNFIIGNAGPVSEPSWWTYALAIQTTSAFGHHVNIHDSGGPATDGNMYANSTYSVGAPSNLDSLNITGSGGVPASVTVNGTFTHNFTALKWPPARNAVYAASANVTLNGDQTFNGYTFTAANQLVYINGNLSYKGKITGTGTFYVTGNVTITGNQTLNNNTNDKLAIITPGTISNTADVTLRGYFYAGTLFSSGGHVNDQAGTIVAYGVNTVSGNLDWDATYDPLYTGTIGTSMKLPGCWP